MNLKASKKPRHVPSARCSRDAQPSNLAGARSLANLVMDRNSSIALDDELKYALAEELFGVCMVVLREYGLDLSRLRDLSITSSEPDLGVPTAQRLLDDALRLSEL